MALATIVLTTVGRGSVITSTVDCRGCTVVVAIGVYVTVVVISVTVVVSVAAAATTDRKVNSIINTSTLSDWYNNTLMIRGRTDSRDPVCTSSEAVGDIGGELTIVSWSVETLEESEDTWIRGLRRVEGLNRFNNDVIVSDDLPSIVQLLGRSEVGSVGIGEGSRLHPLRVQNDGECSVGLHITTVGRELELAGRHVVDARDITHWCGIARATLNLEAVRDGLTDTEVDEVVLAGERVRFAGS